MGGGGGRWTGGDLWWFKLNLHQWLCSQLFSPHQVDLCPTDRPYKYDPHNINNGLFNFEVRNDL